MMGREQKMNLSHFHKNENEKMNYRFFRQIERSGLQTIAANDKKLNHSFLSLSLSGNCQIPKVQFVLQTNMAKLTFVKIVFETF